jgi:hypothetical protein
MTLESLVRPTHRGLYKACRTTGINGLKIMKIKSFFRKKYYLAINLAPEFILNKDEDVVIDNLTSSLNIKEIKREWVRTNERFGVIIKFKMVN